MGPEALAQVLLPLANQTLPNLVVGLHTSDDAAVYRLSDDLAIIQTVDYFTPIVDDAEIFGAIAAANSLSDVYAMGGEVLFGLNIAGFPDTLDPDIIARIFAGGSAKIAEAGGAVAGGHTVTSPEPFYGMSVTGKVAPERIWSKSGARPGDRLILTKAIGTGVITTAAMNDAVEPSHLQSAVDSMLRLNRGAMEAGRDISIHACTDITGFGLLGHAWEMASKGGVRFEIRGARVPLLPGATTYANNGQIAGGLTRNRRYFTNMGVNIAEDVDDALKTLLFDPQTSGGLLIAVSERDAQALLDGLESRGQTGWEIGQVTSGEGVGVQQ